MPFFDHNFAAVLVRFRYVPFQVFALNLGTADFARP